jgi:DNA-binding MarR family transcriptional regulator
MEWETLGAIVTLLPAFPLGSSLRRRTAYAGKVSTDSVVRQTLALAGEDEPEIDVARLRVALARLSRRLRRHDLAGVTPTQLAALATVDRSGPMRLGDLAAAEGIAPSTLTRLVTALEERGYVRRCTDPSDARASTLAITPHGNEMLERIRTETTRMLAASLRMLTPDQRSALAAALPVLEQLAEPDPAETRPPYRGVLPMPVLTKKGFNQAQPGGGPAHRAAWSPRRAAAPAR